MNNSVADWESRFRTFLQSSSVVDTTHDLEHIRRVVASAKEIGAEEKADMQVVIPAAWLHDCVHVEKNSPLRSKASSLSAQRAVEFLQEVEYPDEFSDAIAHCIEAHSFSAGVKPESVEAKVVQDADRLDALGAIGVARCLMTGERMGLKLYHPEDPMAGSREPDDSQYVIDHFFVKLFKLPETMQTEAGRMEATRRAEFLRIYLAQLIGELP